MTAACEQATGPAAVADTDQRGHARSGAQRAVCGIDACNAGGSTP